MLIFSHVAMLIIGGAIGVMVMAILNSNGGDE